MDFVTLATHTDPRRILRHLEQILSDDDQFDQGDAASTIYSDMKQSSAEALSTDRSPIMSKTAEVELYLLATNFLLYTAMVIITTLVSRIYFPQLLERDTSVATPRSYSYRVRSEEEKEDFYASDDEDGKSDEEEELLESDNDDRILESDGNIYRRHAYGFLESNDSLPKVQVLRRLLFCSLMLNATFVLWGLLQERMLTRRYPRVVGEYFTYSYALVFTNRFWTLIMSGMLLAYLRPRASRSTVIYEYSFPAISNLLSSWCQYEALRFISFPAVTLSKSFKLAPVMAMGKILGNKTYPQYDYMVALMIGVGIAMFMASTDGLRIGYNSFGDETNTTWTGVMLLLFFLFFDSFTSQFQSRMFMRHRDLSMVELMFATSAFSTVLSLVTLVHTKELYPALNFVREHSEIHLHFFSFSICSTIGQLFIYYTIKNFGAVVFTLIMTTRILLSIALSCILYGHRVSATGFFGLCLVMAAVLYRIRRKAQGQQLLKWQGMEDSTKAHELVQEWHEHVDM